MKNNALFLFLLTQVGLSFGMDKAAQSTVDSSLDVTVFSIDKGPSATAPILVACTTGKYDSGVYNSSLMGCKCYLVSEVVERNNKKFVTKVNVDGESVRYSEDKHGMVRAVGVEHLSCVNKHSVHRTFYIIKTPTDDEILMNQYKPYNPHAHTLSELNLKDIIKAENIRDEAPVDGIPVHIMNLKNNGNNSNNNMVYALITGAIVLATGGSLWWILKNEDEPKKKSH